jgi:thiol:disulfide interchange protein DsbA
MQLRQVLGLAATVLCLASPALAQPQQPWAPMSPPQPVENNGKIEVIEFFWYGCPHCYAIESEVNAWAARQPKDVDFKRVPAVPSEAWGEAAKIFYTLEALGVLPQYHDKVFDAIHKDNVNLTNKRQRDAWLTKNGIDPAKYDAAEKSFTVATKLARGRQMTVNYKIDSVPRFVVAGKWYTGAELAGGEHQLFPVLDQMIALARQDQAGAAKAAAPAPAKK